MKLEVTITEDELKQIVKDYLQAKFNKVGTKRESIDSIRNDYVDVGVFKSIKCNVEA